MSIWTDCHAEWSRSACKQGAAISDSLMPMKCQRGAVIHYPLAFHGLGRIGVRPSLFFESLKALGIQLDLAETLSDQEITALLIP
jgi:hypothetical protein